MHETEAYNTFRTIYNNRLSHSEHLIEAACIPHRVVMLLLPYFCNTILSADIRIQPGILYIVHIWYLVCV